MYNKKKILMFRILENKKLPSEILDTMLNKECNLTRQVRGFAKNKIISQGKSKKALLVVLFLVNIIFFTMPNDVFAAPLVGGQVQKTGTCIAGLGVMQQVDNQAECSALCVQKEVPTASCVYHDNAKPAENVAANVNVKGADVENPLMIVFKKLLIFVLNLCGWLFGIAATLFAWVIEPSNISGANGVLQKQAVKDVWIMVRDLLNMTFILILLFAAFCTIFQVDKWNLKKVWLNILINALMVNFSYPIARFFIDVSNVAFYYFVNNLFSSTTVVTGSGIFAMFGASSGMGELLAPSRYADFDVAYIIAMIVIVFLMGMTLLVIAALFVVRLIALSMLIMFSPVGFVGYIFPATASYADDWWKKLFSYSFFAPIMIFIMAIALKITEAIGKENMQSFMTNASANAPTDQASWIANAAFLVIPILILWMGMGVAKSMGIAGADTVVGGAQKFSKWAGMKFSGAGFARDTYKAYRTRRDQAKGDKWSNRLGNWAGNQQDRLMGTIPGYTGDHARQRYQSAENARIAEEAKLRDTANMTENELRDLAAAGNKFAQAAALIEIAARGRTDGVTELDQIRNTFGEDSQVFKQMQNKVKAYDPSAAFAHIADVADRQTRLTEHVNSNQFDAKKINANTLGNAEFMQLAFQNQAISNNDLEDLRKKGLGYEHAIAGSLNTIADNFNNLGPVGPNLTADQQRINRSVQMAHFAQTGNLHASIENDADAREQIFSRLNKDTIKRISLNTVNLRSEEIAQFMNVGSYKEALPNIENRQAQRTLNRNILTTNFAALGNNEAEALRQAILNDPRLTNIR
ncbi:MAG: hypothetical protein ACD_9C00337G0001 [uncultured bacterium]|nr:MAG: hypothetical protein ACD_9C00337G0001 [uncultured bacterium]